MQTCIIFFCFVFLIFIFLGFSCCFTYFFDFSFIIFILFAFFVLLFVIILLFEPFFYLAHLLAKNFYFCHNLFIRYLVNNLIIEVSFVHFTAKFNIFICFENNKNMTDVLLFLSVFIPMYVLILVKEIVEILNSNLTFNVLNTLVFIMLICLIILGMFGLWLEIHKSSAKSVKVVILQAENITDRHFLGYFSLFVLFAITFDLSRVSMFVVFIIILTMIGVVYVKNKLFYINPFLNILGYNFYKIKYLQNEECKNTKIFFRGNLQTNKSYCIKVKDENFSFVDKR